MFLLGRLSHNLKRDVNKYDHMGEEVIEGKRIVRQSVMESTVGSEARKFWVLSGVALFKAE